MKNVYGYIRVSTVKQGEGVSLIAQKEAINNYASKYNLNITTWFEEKETAAKQGRPLFMTMMKLLQTKKADGVIIHKIDRGARNLKDWADLGNLIDQGIEVHFAHESLDLQARGGRLSADIQAVIAADYIRNLRQEAIKGIYGRLKQGIYPFNAPIGYLNTGKGNYKTIDPIQGPLVKKVFELYASKRYSLNSLTQKMNELGLRTNGQKKIYRNSISHILNNSFYMGIIKIKGQSFNGGHEPLVSPAVFKEVQDALWGNTNQKIKKHTFKYSRLIACGGCGYSLTPETQRGHTYYRCHIKSCVTKGINEKTIENFMVKAFTLAELYPEECEALDGMLIVAQQEWRSKQQILLDAVRLQAAQVQDRMERLTDCYVDGGLEREIYEARKFKLLEEIKSKEATEKGLFHDTDKILGKTKTFFEQAKNLTDAYQKANSSEKRKLVQKVTSNIKSDGKYVMIAMKSPFSELVNRQELICGAPGRDSSRILGGEFAKPSSNGIKRSFNNQKRLSGLTYSSIYTSPITGEPLSNDKLRQLFNLIVDQVAQLPDIPNEL
jgi:site-specific DNA recombinase